jgi:hypothetical protein
MGGRVEASKPATRPRELRTKQFICLVTVAATAPSPSVAVGSFYDSDRSLYASTSWVANLLGHLAVPDRGRG